MNNGTAVSIRDNILNKWTYICEELHRYKVQVIQKTDCHSACGVGMSDVYVKKCGRQKAALWNVCVDGLFLIRV